MDLPSLRRPNSSSHPLRGGCLTAQQLEIPRYRFDAAVEVGKMELLIGGVEIIVRQSKAHHHARDAEVAVEDAHDRNGAARADVHRFLSERPFQRSRRGMD